MDFELNPDTLNPAAGGPDSLSENHEIASLRAALAERDAELAGSRQELRRVNLKLDALMLELAHHRRIRYGHKNEAFSPDQRQLFQETWDTDLAAIEAEVEECKTEPRPKRARSGRQALPAHLPRIEDRHEPESCRCGKCGNDLVKIGEDVSEKLDVEPSRFFVHRHIRPQYACRSCQTITAAPIPPALIDGGLASPGLLSWVMVSKFTDHLPLNRIEQIAAREQVILPRSNLSDWVGHIGVWLQPLSDRLREMLLQRAVLHADETPVPLLDPGKGKTQRAYLWAYRSNNLESGPPIIVFDFQPGRGGQYARDFLRQWQGSLMVDDYVGYKPIMGNGITELACLAHCRRKYLDLHVANQNPVAAEALRRIGELYAIEEQGRSLSIDERRRLRAEHAKPRLEALHAWLIAMRSNIAEGGALAKAIDYSLRRWTAVQRYVESGSLPIDNNPVENAIRPISLGKKNWLFAGSERAGKRAAAIQSLLGTAKLNGIEPYAWLKDTLEKLPTWKNSRIDELLPLRISNA